MCFKVLDLIAYSGHRNGGQKYDSNEKRHGGIHWYLLAGFRRLRYGSARGDISECRSRFAGSVLAFGLTVLTMAFAIGHISGCHLNPAVTVGLVVAKRFPAADLLCYMTAQVAGAVAAAAVLYVIASGRPAFDLAAGFASNGYAAHSPGGYSLLACLIAEIVLTFMFFIIILGATDRRAPQGFAPIPIGLGLTLIHLVGIPVTNLSVNPARSTGPAIFVGGWALEQLWLFWLAPVMGALLAGVVYAALAEEKDAKLEGRTVTAH